MARSNRSTETPVEQTDNSRTSPVDVGPDQSLALAAAFDGIYHLFGGRVENWEVTPDGMLARGFTVNSDYDPSTILADINRKEGRRPQLWPTISWIMGNEPEHFATPLAITQFGVQWFKGSVREGTSQVPKYVRDAQASYKAERGGEFSRKRGARKSTLKIKELAEYNEDALLEAGLTPAQIEHLANIATRASQRVAAGTAN